jgi:DNA topoisomerase IA
MKLVVVESTATANPCENYLCSCHRVLASFGVVRELRR